MAVSNNHKIGHYILGRTIGLGAFGKVKVSKHELTGDNVAVKIISKKKIQDRNMSVRVKREIQFLRYFNHPNIIKLYEVLETQTDVFVVMEYASKGELFDAMNPLNPLPESRVRYIFRQLIAGVEHCHSNLVTHRDLKLENILLDENDTIKIADFGLSNLMKDGKFLKTDCGSPNYAAPEILSKSKYCGTEIDTWSCGVILFSLLTGSLPFEDELLHILFQKITEADYRMPKYLSIESQDLIRKMLQPNPIDRIKFHEIIQHPWLRNTEVLYLDPKDMKYYINPIKINQELFEKLKSMDFNFRGLCNQKIRESIKDKRDFSFVVGYSLMQGEAMKKQLSLTLNKEKQIQEGILQNQTFAQNRRWRLIDESPSQSEEAISSVLNGKQMENDALNNKNGWHYGFEFTLNPSVLMKFLIESLNELDTSYTVERKDYKINCAYRALKSPCSPSPDQSFDGLTVSTNSTSVASGLSDLNSDKESSIIRENKFAKNELVFKIRLYSLSKGSQDHIVDIQRTAGHTIMFLSYCQDLLNILRRKVKPNEDNIFV